MHFFWRGSCSAQVLSWCLHGLWGQRLLLRSALQVRCARSPEGRAPRTPRREGQSRVGSTDPSVFLWAQENSLNVPIASHRGSQSYDARRWVAADGDLGRDEGVRGRPEHNQLHLALVQVAAGELVAVSNAALLAEGCDSSPCFATWPSARALWRRLCTLLLREAGDSSASSVSSPLRRRRLICMRRFCNSALCLVCSSVRFLLCSTASLYSSLFLISRQPCKSFPSSPHSRTRAGARERRGTACSR